MWQATHYRLNQDFMMFISRDHVLFRFKVHWTFIARYSLLILIPNGYFDPSFCFPSNYFFSLGKLKSFGTETCRIILFDDDDDNDVKQEEREEDKVREKEEEMSRKSKFSQNNLLKCLITICAYLQILQNAAPFSTQCAHYYKMRNVLQNASLLQNATEQGCSICVQSGQ